MTTSNSSPKSRSAVLIILSLVAFFISVFGWLRFVEGISGWMFLQEIGPAVLPLYLLISGLIWGITGIVAAFGIWFHRRWALILLACGVGIFTLWYWLDRIILSANPDANSNWIFSLVMTGGILAYFIGSILAVWEETG
jgi:uncharacterized membrane protein YidH (DUF202 family)